MSDLDEATPFFVAGGALRINAPSYVSRLADEQLRRCVADGELCYVLTTRQMGKSSLMAHTAEDLRKQSFHVVTVDLTTLGRAPEDEWYFSFLDELETQLSLETDLTIWWGQHDALSSVRRFTKFLEEVVLQEIDGRIVIFVDEVDSALNLDFADNFFAAVRALYNRGRYTTQSGRLSFVLLGVAAPDDLIKDQRSTPFNIGIRLELNEFSRQDGAVLLHGLPRNDPAILERIFYWTNGHPYLTQRIGKAIVEEGERGWDDAAVDELVESLFFTKRAAEQESNLLFVNRRVIDSPQKKRLLSLYRNIYRGKVIQSMEQSPVQNELKLYGLIRADEDDRLMIRNRIYQTVFNEAWIKENLPVDPWRRIALVGALVMLITFASLIYYVRQRPKPVEVLGRSYLADFQSTSNPALRLGYLGGLMMLDDYRNDAVRLFSSLPTDEQVELFASASSDLLPQVRDVAAGVYTRLYVVDLQNDVENTTRVLQAIARALGQAEDAPSRALRDEIRAWLVARDYARAGDFSSAEIAYSLVIDFNENNPATHIERAQTLAAQQDFVGAVADLIFAWEQGPPWDQSVIDMVNRDWQLYMAVLGLPDPPGFAANLATPTVSKQGTLPPGQLAFVSSRDGNEEIYLMDSDGTNLIRLTNNPAQDYSPAWSPDGNWLSFTSDRDGDHEIYIMRVDGSDVRQTTHNNAFNCCSGWSPDGTKLVYNSNWPDGDQDIYVINIDGSGAVNLTDFPGDDWAPDWSPDGSAIVFDARRDGQAEIYIMNPDGTNQQRLTKLFSSESGGAWSPNSQYIAYHSNQLPNNDGTQGYEHLFVMERDGTNPTQLTTTRGNDTWPSWHPDGQLIVFTSDRDNNDEIYVIRRDGTGLVRLTNHPALDTAPVWRP